MNSIARNIAPELLESLCGELSAAATAVLTQVAGAELQAKVAPLVETDEPITCLQLTLTGAVEGRCELKLDAAMSLRFAGLLMGESPAPNAEVTQETREAAAELLGQICGNAADRLRKRHGPLELKTHLVDKPGDTTLDNNPTDRRRIVINGCGDPMFIDLYVATLVAEPAITQPDVQPASAPAFTTGSRNLDLLLDIELGASLRFGTRQMLLKDVLELCSGSVVELDRKVQEPVELLIDGRVIAQGEVVIVDGNYGLRILQVASPGEKIACLPQAG